jgi:aconitate hydratase
VPPETGIVHQVNIEYLARVICRESTGGKTLVYPDTVFGTDSHTTMVNGLGVVGWGVGGIEAEAAMLGQPSSMLIPQVVGYKLTGRLPEGTTATDLVLTITEALRKRGVVGKFVEFFGPGLKHLTIADRVTLGNMCPEYGATVAVFPIRRHDARVPPVHRPRRRSGPARRGLCEGAGLFRTDATPDASYTETLELDLSSVEPSLAGPRRPQDRVPARKGEELVRGGASRFEEGHQDIGATAGGGGAAVAEATATGIDIDHGSVVDRRDHQLHEHVESERDDRRGPGAKRAVELGLTRQAVGERRAWRPDRKS